jgi:pSer/pThr/pTyr-binding forkhead associated (FHA) protein
MQPASPIRPSTCTILRSGEMILGLQSAILKPMPATIRYRDGERTRVVLLGDVPAFVGRLPDCAVRTSDSTVTRRHARIYRDGDQYWIEDLGSDNGVHINGELVRRAPLAKGAKVHCGRLVLEYCEE